MIEIGKKEDGSFDGLTYTATANFAEWHEVITEPTHQIVNIWGANGIDDIREFMKANKRLSFCSPNRHVAAFPTVRKTPVDDAIINVHSKSKFDQIVALGKGEDVLGELMRLGLHRFHEHIKEMVTLNPRSNVSPARFLRTEDSIYALVTRRILVIDTQCDLMQLDLLPFIVWSIKAVQAPVIILSHRPIPVLRVSWDQPYQCRYLQSPGIDVDALQSAICDAWRFDRADVQSAYRVWLASMTHLGDGDGTTALSGSDAAAFCAVVSRSLSNTPSAVSRVHPARAAPLMFDAEHGSLKVRETSLLRPADSIVQRGAEMLIRRCNRILSDDMLSNSLPSLADSLISISELLEIIHSGIYDDGHIVGLGMEFHATQWSVGTVKELVGTSALADVVGLFSSGYLFLGGFEVWKAYVPPASEDRERFIAQLRDAIDLLSGARSADLFDPAASARVSSVMQRGASVKAAPSLQEGVVAVGQNLSAEVVLHVNDLNEGIVHPINIDGKTGEGQFRQFAAEHGQQLIRLLKDHPEKWVEMAIDVFEDWLDGADM